MSLQDEHLQQALKEAPDRDLAPDDAVRKKVFAYANASAKSQKHWLLRWFAGLSRIQLAGMGTIASVVIVMLMIYPQASNDSVWSNAEEADIALSEQVPLEDADSGGRLEEQTSTLKQLKSEENVTDKVLKKEVPSKPVAVAPAIKKATNLPKKSLIKKTAPKPITKEKASDVADDTVINVVDAEVAETIVLAESEAFVDKLDAEPPAVASAAPQSQSRQKKDTLVANKRTAMSPQSLNGIALAKQDIATGRLRILLAANSWPEGQARFDADTGFNIELSEMNAEEVAAYNATVRDWYRKNQ